MPETNEIPINVKATADLKGIDETNLALDNLKKNLKSFGEAFQMGKILYQMDQLEEKYKAIGLQVEAATGQIRNSAGTLLSVDQAAKQVADSMNKAANSSVGVAQKIREIKTEFSSFTQVEKFKNDMASVGIIVDEVKSKAGIVEFRFTTNTGDIISARDAMTKLKTATDTARIAQDKLLASQKQMKLVMSGISSMFRGLQNVVLGLGLSMLFLGMQIKRTSENIARAVLETYQKIVEGGTYASRGMLALGGAFTFLKFVIGDAIAEALLPFIPIIIDIVEAVADWVDENPELVAALVLGAIALGTFLFVAGQLITPLATLVGLFAILSNPALAAGIGPALAVIEGAIGGIVAALPAILLTLAWITIVIAAVVYAWATDFNGFRNTVAGICKSIAKTFADLMDNLYDVFKDAFATNIPALLNNFFSFFQNAWDGNFDAALANVGLFLVNYSMLFTKGFTFVIYAAAKVIVLLYDVFLQVAGWIIGVIMKLSTRIAGLFLAAVGALMRAAAMVVGLFGDVVGLVIKGIAGVVEIAVNLIQDLFNTIIEGYNAVARFFGKEEISIDTRDWKIDTTGLDKSIADFKNTFTNAAESFATAITISPELIAETDLMIDKSLGGLVDQLRTAPTAVGDFIDKILGADAVNAFLNPVTASLEKIVTDLTGTTDEVVTTDYYTGSMIEKAATTQLDTIKALRDYANGIDDNVQAAKSSTDAVKIFTDAMANLPLDSIKALVSALMDNSKAQEEQTSTTLTITDAETGEKRTVTALVANSKINEDLGKVNLDAVNATNENTIVMGELLKVLNTMNTANYTAPLTSPTQTNQTQTVNNTTTVQVDMSGITATNGSVVIPQAQLIKLIQDTVNNSMKAWTENFKQGMNSYGV